MYINDPNDDGSFPANGIWYFANSTTFMVEWMLASTPQTVPAAVYHFQAVYSYASPAVWLFKYYSVPDGGANALIGIQGEAAAEFSQFSIDGAVRVAAGNTVTCDTSSVKACVLGTFAL